MSAAGSAAERRGGRGAAPAPALPSTLSSDSPKGEQLREILEGLIGASEPGSPLPSERALCERYGVARMTVRSELDRLVSEGLVYRVHGRGTFVGEPRVVQSAALSSFTEDMRARGMTPRTQVLRQEVTAADARLAGRLGLAPETPVIRIDRLRCADGVPMAVEEAFLPAGRFPGLEDEDLGSRSLFDLLEEGFGVSMPAAEQRVVAVAIEDDHAELLEVPPGHPGLLFRTLARDPDGAPVFYAWSLYRGDRYEIEMRQHRRGGAGEDRGEAS